MSLFNHLSVKWKIYLIAIVSIIGFGGYLGFNVWVNSNNAKLLTSLRSVSFPVLEKATANRVRLDRLSEQLNNAVTTGELDSIVSAEDTAVLMNNEFIEIIELIPSREQEIVGLQESFIGYFELASEIATDMSQGTADMATISISVASKEAASAKIIEDLDAFISSAHQNFSTKISDANDNSRYLLTSGFMIWFANILVLSITVYAIARIILSNINNVSESLHELARGGGDLSKQIVVSSSDEIGKLASSFNELMDNLREKTNDLISMMQNMHQGLVTITDQGVIHHEYAAYIEEIFSTKDVAGRKYFDLLFSSADIGSDTLDQIKATVSSLIGSDEMMFEFNSHILISEYSINIEVDGVSKRKIIELDWDPIVSDGEINKIMVTARDVTELKSMQAEAEKQKHELEIIGQILKASPDKFDAFAKNCFMLIDQNETIIKNNQHKNPEAIADLFVNMHTIKGNARTYNFNQVTDFVHEAENVYDRLRKEDDYPWESSKLLKDLDIVRQAVSGYVEIKSEKLNFSKEDSISVDNLVKIPRESYQKVLDEIGEIIKYDDVDKEGLNRTLNKIRTFDAVPLASAIDELIGSLPSLAQQLGKEEPRINISAENIGIRHEYVGLVNDVFTHLLRNCIDHGIEDAEERKINNKSSKGIIYLEVNVNDQNVDLILWDDGRGLPLQRIKKKALESNQLTELDSTDPNKIAECLFYSGLSTAESVTAISGRGVGMDAVRKYLDQSGCHIQLQLEDSAVASDEFAPFKTKVTLARNIYETLDEVI